jgi:AraC family transcriptional regulator
VPGASLERAVLTAALDTEAAGDTAYALDEIADAGQAIDFRSATGDFSIRLSTSGPRRVAEHAHDNIQISIPLGSTIASVAWRTRGGALKHALARRGHALIIPSRQRHAVAWKNRARFVNIHLSASTTSDERYGFLRRVARLGEAHVIADRFLARLGEIIVLRAAKHPGLDEAALQSFRMIVETHVMQPYPSAAASDAALRAPPRQLERSESSGLSGGFLKKITTAIRRDLARDWTVEELAGTLKLSEGHFSRAFRRSTGASPRQWIIRQRIDAAMDKLLMTQDPLAEIAFACGFAEQTHFTRTFTRMVGTSPGAWRRRYQH